jgi:hypothetical protein
VLTIDFKSVHIQAFGFPEKPGIVAFANLSDPNVEDTLRKHRAYRNVPASACR